MLEHMNFLMLPITACVICALLFGYFGLHVLLRGVLFVDIALAQVAALGTLTGMLCGIGRESDFLALVALLAVTAAATLLATVNFSSAGVPQEGLIGIIYCLALAVCLFLAEFIPEGSGFVKESLTGALLWVSWNRIVKLAVVGALVAAFHVIFRQKFINHSSDCSRSGGRKTGWWEFMFYFTLGIVIVEAVRVLGVFLVFSMLVVPAAVGLMFCTSWTARIAVAWLVGIFTSLAGILGAYAWTLPTGPSIVVLLGLVLILASMGSLALARTPAKTSTAIPLEPNSSLEAE